MDKDKYLPRRFSLNTGSRVGAATIRAINIIQKDNTTFLSIVIFLQFKPTGLFPQKGRMVEN